MLLLILFFCQEWGVRYHYCIEWWKYKKDLKICNGLICLDNKSFFLNMFVCMYLFVIVKKSLKIVHSLILQSEKLSD